MRTHAYLRYIFMKVYRIMPLPATANMHHTAKLMISMCHLCTCGSPSVYTMNGAMYMSSTAPPQNALSVCRSTPFENLINMDNPVTNGHNKKIKAPYHWQGHFPVNT